MSNRSLLILITLKKKPGEPGEVVAMGVAFLGSHGFTTQRHRNGALV